MTQWWDNFTSDPIGTVSDTASDVAGGVADFFTSGDSGSNLGNLALTGLSGLAMSKFGDAQIPQVGYQGKIPAYQAVRDRVATDPDRRVGGRNQRYFTDLQFADRPSTDAPSVTQAQAQAAQQRARLEQRNLGIVPQDPEPLPSPITPPYMPTMAEGGRYLAGSTDGMADVVPARIEGGQEARLSDGEFVVPADVVSHLGNGNSDAGAKQLYGMMDNIREARTGRKEQGIQIDPNKFMPNMAQGGIAKFQGADGSLVEGTDSDIAAANENAQSGVTGIDPEGYTPVGVGRQGALAEFAGEYTTDLLGKGRAIAETPYEAYTGPLTAGESGLETQAFQGLAGLQAPETMGGYTPTTLDATQVSRFMNPYLEAALNPQIEAAIRQAEIQRVADAGRLTKAGAYGGSRQAVMEAEGQRALQDRIAGITGQGYATAYDKALARFDQEEARQREAQQMANKYGFDVLGAQTRGGQLQRAIEGEGIAADRAQFEEEKLFPYKQIQYQKFLLEGLPISAQEIQYSQPSGIQNVLGNTAFLSQLLGNTDPEDGNILTDIFRAGSDFIDLFD